MFEWTKNQNASFTTFTKESSEKDQHKMQTPFFYMLPNTFKWWNFYFYFRSSHLFFPINNLKQNRISNFNIEKTKAKNFFSP